MGESLVDAVVQAMLDTGLDVVLWERSAVEELAYAAIRAYKKVRKDQMFYRAYVQFASDVARLVIPGDDEEAMRARVKAARERERFFDHGLADLEPTWDDDAVIEQAPDDGFIENEVRALWAMVRRARALSRCGRC